MNTSTRKQTSRIRSTKKEPAPVIKPVKILSNYIYIVTDSDDNFFQNKVMKSSIWTKYAEAEDFMRALPDNIREKCQIVSYEVSNPLRHETPITF